MSKSRAIAEYKEKLMAKIIANKQILALVDKDKINHPDDYMYDNFFNFIRVPDSPEDEKNYICLEVDIPEIYSEQNNVYGKLVITIYIISHVNLMRTHRGGTRIDLISALIDDMFNNKRIVGLKKLELISNVAGNVNDKNACRVMTFYAEDLAVECYETKT
jgi:hypothetical protein